MRIGIITSLEYGRWGGCEPLWLEAARHALSAGDQIAVSLSYGPETIKRTLSLEDSGARLFWRKQKQTLYWRRRQWLIECLRESRISCLRFLGDHWRKRSSELTRFFEWKPDVIIVNLSVIYDCYTLPNLAEELAKYEIPYITVTHAANDLLPPRDEIRNITRRVQLAAKAAFFVSLSTQRIVERHLACSLPNATIIRNPVNIKETTALPMPLSEAAEFAFVGRLEIDTKGLDLLFEALALEQWKCRHWRLTLYGEGFDKMYLQELAKYYGVQDKVVFSGYSDNIRYVWQNAHLLVLPSRTESAPLALVEAMLCGRPAVVTDVGGVTEWVSEPDTGFVAEAASARSIGNALERAWSARAKWAEMGKQAHLVAKSRIDRAPGQTLIALAKAFTMDDEEH